MLAAWAGGAGAQQVLGPSGTAYPGAGMPGSGGENAPAEAGFIDADGGLSYTDNAQMTAAAHTSDEMVLAGLDADYVRQGSRLSLSAVGQIDWTQYIQNTFSGTPYGHFLGNATWGHPTDVLQWVLNDTFGEGSADPLAAPTPENVEFVNYFTTGPYVNLNFSGTDRLTLHGLYSRMTYQDSPFDDESYDGGASLTHELSPLSNVALRGDFVRTRFAGDAQAPDYDTRTASLFYHSSGVRTSITAAAGYTLVDFRGPQSGAPLLSLQLSRTVSAFSSVFARAQTGFTNAGDALNSDLGTPVGAASLGETPLAATTAPYKERSVNAGWDFNRARTRLSVYGTWEQQQYQQVATASAAPESTLEEERALSDSSSLADPGALGDAGDFAAMIARQVRPITLGTATNAASLNNTYESVAGTLSRTLRPTLTLSLSANRTWARYENLDGSYADAYAMLSLRKQFSRLMVAAYAMRRHHSTSGATSEGGAFDEDLIGVYATYDLVGHRFLGGGMPGAIPGLPGVPGF